MAAVDGLRQRWGQAVSGAACGVGWSLHRALMLVLALGLLLLLGAGALAWRLSQGPLDVAWLARRAEAMLNADAPARVQFSEATMRWRGFHEGAGGGLDLQLRDLEVVSRSGAPGAPGAAVTQADVSLSVGRLLIGQAVPRSVRLQGVRLRAVRAADGGVTLDLGGLTDGPANEAPGPSLAETLRQLGRPASHDGAAERVLEELAQLSRVQVEDAVVQVVDAQLGATVALTVGRLDLQRQAGGGVRGTAEGEVALAGARAALTLQADLAADGGTSMTVALAPVKLAEVARANAALDPLSMLDATVQGEARLDLSPSLRPRSAVLQASAGGGKLRLGTVDLPFQSLALEMGAGWTGGALRPGTMTLRRAQVVLASPRGGWSTTLGATAQAVRDGGRITGTFDATLDHVEFADLPALWPEALGGNVRPWLVQNLTSGTARDGVVRLGFEAREDFTAPAVVQAAGSLVGDDATIHWLRPVAPIEHAQAVLTVRSPDVLEIAIPTARQGGMVLRDGSVRITGLSGRDQTMAISSEIGAGVAEVVALLRHPRLRLLDRKPIPMRNPAGTLAARLTVELPLVHDLDFDQVKIRAAGRLANLHLGGLVAGRDLDRGDIQIEVTSEQLKASGPANIANIPGTIAVEMDFRGGPPAQVVQRAKASARATGRQLAGAGLDPGGLMPSGAGAFTATYTARRDGQAEVRVEADLRDAGLELVGWKKPPGQPATAAARVVLRGDKLLGIEAVEAQGPGLAVSGRVDMVGDRPLLLQFDKLVLGNTQASGEVRLPATPAEPIRARLSGAVLDIAGELARKPTRAGPQDRDPSWVADIRFDRVLLAAGRGLSGVQAHAEHDGLRLRALQAASSGRSRRRCRSRRAAPAAS